MEAPPFPLPDLSLLPVPDCPGGWKWVTAMRREIGEASPGKKRLAVLLIRVTYLAFLYPAKLPIQRLTPPPSALTPNILLVTQETGREGAACLLFVSAEISVLDLLHAGKSRMGESCRECSCLLLHYPSCSFSLLLAKSQRDFTLLVYSL